VRQDGTAGRIEAFIGGSVLLVLLIVVFRFARSKCKWLRRLR